LLEEVGSRAGCVREAVNPAVTKIKGVPLLKQGAGSCAIMSRPNEEVGFFEPRSQFRSTLQHRFGPGKPPRELGFRRFHQLEGGREVCGFKTSI
jgi:hypothetical protein